MVGKENRLFRLFFSTLKRYGIMHAKLKSSQGRLKICQDMSIFHHLRPSGGKDISI